MEIKEYAIYQLPNGRELIAQRREGAMILSKLSVGDDASEFELNSEGRLIFNGRLTGWDMSDLVETGRVATPDKLNVLSESVQTLDQQKQIETMSVRKIDQ